LKFLKRTLEIYICFLALFWDYFKKRPLYKFFFFPSYLAFKNKIEPYLKYPPSKRFRKILEDLGPTFIKLGQILSLRLDFLPPDFIEELSHLQDKGPKVSFSVLQKLLGSKIYAFEYIEEKPIGVGSIAQVHKGVLKTGEKVAIKFIKPQVREQIKIDLKILKVFLNFLYTLPFLKTKLKRFNLKNIFEEIEDILKDELNLENESSYLTLFRENLNLDFCYIPKVYWDLSNKDILVMEYVEGEKITEFVKKHNLSYKEIEDLIIKFLKIAFRQLFELSYFHADLHPGNIVVTKDRKICLLDFGIVGRIPRKLKLAHSLFIYGIIRKDENIILYALKLAGLIKKDTNVEKLKRHILKNIDKYLGRPLKRISLKDYIYEEIENAKKFNIHFSEDLVLLLKTIIHIESLVRYLYPDFVSLNFLKDYTKKILPNLILDFTKYKLEKFLFKD